MSGRMLIPIILVLILGYVFYNEVLVRNATKNLFNGKNVGSLLGSKDSKTPKQTEQSPEAINKASQVATSFLQQVQAGNFSAALSLYSQSAFDGFSPQERLSEMQRQRSEMFGRLQNFQLVSYSQEGGQVSLRYSVTYEKTNTQETFVVAVGTFSGGGFKGGGMASRGVSGGSILSHYVSSNVF